MEDCHLVDKIIQDKQCPDNVICVRWAQYRYHSEAFRLQNNKSVYIGYVYTDPGFVSTSLLNKYIGKYDTEPERDIVNHYYFLIIKIPQGATAIYVEPISQRREYELIINRGYQYKVIDIHYSFSGKPIGYTVELLNHSTEPTPSLPT